MTTHDDCRGFRRRLARALEGRPMPQKLTELSWHEHLLGCAECRALLEREEALEVLLATLPEPQLPPDVVRRLVARLDHASDGAEPAELDALLELASAEAPAGLSNRVLSGVRAEAALDALLDLDPQPVAPAGLARSVRDGVRARVEGELDRLLDLDPKPVAPRELARDVLARLESDRVRSVPRLRLVRSLPRYAAAAAVLLAALGATWWVGGGTEPSRDIEELAQVAPVVEPDDNLLAMLDVLGNDSLWQDTASGAQLAEEDLELLLADEFEPEVEVLLAYLPEDELGTNGPSGR